MFGGTTNVNVHLANADALHQIQTSLDRIEKKLDISITKEDEMAASIDDVKSAVSDEKTVVDSAVTLLNQLSAMLAAAIASGDPAKVQAVLDAINANKQELADAVAQNTPAAP